MTQKLCLKLCFVIFPTVLQMMGDESVASDLSGFWRKVLTAVRNTALNSSVQYLLGLQWAIWLATCQLKTIREFQVKSKLQDFRVVNMLHSSQLMLWSGQIQTSGHRQDQSRTMCRS